jgi:putative ABC transport system permease protein
MRLDELRQAVRSLRASPAFSLLVIATLGLGAGTSTAMFSLVDAVLLRPLPFDQPERLVALWTAVPKDGLSRFRVSSFDFTQWLEERGLFERLALTGSASATLTGTGAAAELPGTRVTGDYFPALGVHAQLGRLFSAGDYGPSASPVVVLSHALWVGRFGADPGALGRTIVLDDQPHVVVGILPRQLLPIEAQASGSVPFTRDEERFWVPLELSAPAANAHVFGVLARLRPGVTMAQARARLAVVERRLQSAFPETNDGSKIVMVPLVDEALGAVRSSLWMLLAAVACLLVIACVNVTHLLMLRAASREREIAVRAALGAGRGAIARLFLAEDLLLTLAAGGVAAVLALGAIRGVIEWNPIDVPRLADAALDVRALAVSLAACLGASLLLSTAPVFFWAVRDPAGALRGAGKGSAPVATRSWRRALAMSETGLAVVLVVGAGLVAKSFARLRLVDPGFTSGRVLVFDLETPQAHYPERAQLVGLYQALFQRLASVPGVTHVAGSYDPPLASNWYQSFDLPGLPPRSPAQDRGALFRTVTPAYFDTLGVKLLSGRSFNEADDVGAAGAAVVNEAFARRFLEGRNPLGHGLELTTTQWRWGDAVPRSFRIVGVVKNEHFGDLTQPPEPAFYLPFRQTPQDKMSVLVRTRIDPATLVPVVRQQIRALDPRLALAGVTTLDGIQSASVARPRFRTLVLVGFAASALFLALIGLSGVLSDAVLQRRREIGIRMAIGAGPSNVFALLLREGLRPALHGLVLGLAGALVLGRLLAGMLYQVAPADPEVFAIAAVSLMAVGVAACSLSAWRACRTEPRTALRSE